jgi:hypothetical protein
MNYQEKLDQVNQEINILESRIREVEKEHRVKLSLRISKLISEANLDFKEDEIDVSTSSVHFYKPRDTSRYNIFTFYFREGHNIHYKEMDFTDIELSYYTTGISKDNFEFEINRLQLLGQAATFLKNKKQDMLDILTEENKFYRNQLLSEKLYEQVRVLTLQKKDLTNIMFEQEKTEMVKKLCSTGLDFGDDKQYIELKNGYTIYALTIKVDSISTSGKTCTISFTTPYWTKGMTEERVSMQRLVQQLLYIKNKITN